MTTTVTLVFLISTYFIQKGITSTINKDIIFTLEERDLKIKEEDTDQIADILTDYTGTYMYDRILQCLSIFPICNVIYATHNVLIYMKEKDIIIDEILETDIARNNSSNIRKQYSIEKENNKINETNNYYLDEGKPKMMVKKKSK